MAGQRGVVADEVVHFDGFGAARGHAQRQAADGADVVFELAGGRAFDGPVAGIVDARGHLVEHRAMRGGEELQRQHADIVQRLSDLGGELARSGTCASTSGTAGTVDVEECRVMRVCGGVPERHAAICRAHEDDRKLGLEVDEAFVDRRHTAERRTQPRSAPASTRALALAVVPDAARS